MLSHVKHVWIERPFLLGLANTQQDGGGGKLVSILVVCFFYPQLVSLNASAKMNFFFSG